MNKLNLLWLRAPLLMAVAALAACSDEERFDVPQEQQTWKLVVHASKSDGDSDSRSVKIVDEKLKSKWDANTPVEVYDGNTKVGTLYSSASEDGNTTLVGLITGTYEATYKQLALYSPSRTLDYSGQDGTPEGMKDYMTGIIIIERISLQERLLTTSNVEFERLQAFNKFTLADGYNVQTLEITGDNLEGSPVVVTASTDRNVFYVGLRTNDLINKTTYTFTGKSADGAVNFLGTASARLKYGKYYKGTISLNPSISVIIQAPWNEGDDLGTNNILLNMPVVGTIQTPWSGGDDMGTGSLEF